MHSFGPHMQQSAAKSAENPHNATVDETAPAVVAIDDTSAEKEKLLRLDQELYCLRTTPALSARIETVERSSKRTYECYCD